MDDRDQVQLLRQYEPVLRFNRGERFFPTDVSAFVKRADLWVREHRGTSRRIASSDELSLDRLDQVRGSSDRDVLFLRASSPLSATEIAKHTLKEKRHSDDPRDVFRAGRGRLARVGYTSRIAGSLFSLSLLARGRVPGDLATSASIIYRDEMREAENYHYYGRVVERGSWTALQYWYFYFFNDWRSHFFGTNDHEGDWEMVTVYLDTGASGGAKPEWIASSCHEYSGAEVRRAWDDPDLEKQGDHPVVYAGAGSHAGYYRPGDYLGNIEVPALRPFAAVARTARSFWRDTLHQYVAGVDEPAREGRDPTFGVPFIDYARGDGHAIGPGEERCWSEPEVVNSETPWVRYRGLWGYFANDPFAGEDAPPGPMYNRDGTVRLAWQDPVAWGGLLSVPPSSRRESVVAAVHNDLDEQRREKTNTVQTLREALHRVGVEAAAVEGKPHLVERARELRERGADLTNQLSEAQDTLIKSTDVIEALDQHPEGVANNTTRGLQPLSPERLRAGRLAEVWAALSVGGLLIGLVLLATFAREHLVWGAAVLLAWYVVIEAVFRNRLIKLVTTIAVALALICTVVLLIEFYRPLTIALAVGIGLFLLWENFRELWT